MLPQSQQVLFDWNCWDSIVRTPQFKYSLPLFVYFMAVLNLTNFTCWFVAHVAPVAAICGGNLRCPKASNSSPLLWASNRRSSCRQSWGCQPVSWCAKTLCYRSSEGGQEEYRWSVCASTTSSLDEEVDDPWHFSWENKKTQAWPG